MNGVFVTGTDTDVGKTWVSTRLIIALRAKGVDAVGMKPIECGGREDSEALLSASAHADLTLDDINPIALPEAVAPAAVSNPVSIKFETLKSRVDTLCGQSDFVVVEGAGGWAVPIDEERTMADLAADFGFPVIIVAANRLGVLNHTLLTAQAIQAAGQHCIAVHLNLIPGEGDLSQKTNRKMLERNLDGVPVIDQDVKALAELLIAS